MAARNAPRASLAGTFEKLGFKDFRWLDPKAIKVSQWVRMKCMFGCGEYGKNACCPPNVPSVSECAAFFREYRSAAVFRFTKALSKPGDRHDYCRRINLKLIKVEREVFIAGHHKAFMLFMDSCSVCRDCTGARTTCASPRLARPTPEAMGVDVFATLKGTGYPIEVLSDYTQAMNRYAFLMID
jgi:predicted metal-binding protein